MDVTRYLRLFVCESREHLERARSTTRALCAPDSAPEATREMLRHAHSIKGMAASMGYGTIASLAHAAEDLLDSLQRSRRTAARRDGDLLSETLDALETMVGAAECGAEIPAASALESALRGRAEEAGAPAPGETSGGRSAADLPPAPAPQRVRVRATLEADLRALPALRAAEILGRLTAFGRVVSSDPPPAALRLGRFHGALEAEVETRIPPDEIARSLAATPGLASIVADRAPVLAPPREPPPAGPLVRVPAERLDALLRAASDLMVAQGRVLPDLARSPEPGTRQSALRCQSMLRALHAEIVEMRLVPFEAVEDRFAGRVQDLASQLGKRVRLEIAGREVRLDRSVLDALVDPLLHMIRNALDHGIESPAERAAAGKEAEGRLSIELERHGEELRVSVRDDGRGMDAERLRIAAVERGLLSASDAAALDEASCLGLSTLPGLTTAVYPSALSGRGVGMDVVRSDIERLGGRLTISSESGRGTTIAVRIPLTLAVVPTLLVRCRAETFALPISTVSRLVRFDGEPGSRAPLPSTVVRLAERLRLPGSDREGGAPEMALCCSAGDRAVGIVVDEVLGRRDALVQPLRPPLSALREYSGAALLDDGSVALLLDPAAL